ESAGGGFLAPAPVEPARPARAVPPAPARTFRSGLPLTVHQIVPESPAPKQLGQTGLLNFGKAVNIPAGAEWYVQPLGGAGAIGGQCGAVGGGGVGGGGLLLGGMGGAGQLGALGGAAGGQLGALGGGAQFGAGGGVNLGGQFGALGGAVGGGQ